MLGVIAVLFTLATVSAPQQTMLSLGDSYTIGEGVAEADRWPMQLVEQLNQEGLSFAAPQIIAKTGWTTDELQTAIKDAVVADRYDWVTLLIGVNNQYRNRDVEQFRTEFRSLLNYAIEKTGGNPQRVVVLSIPDWGVTPFAEGRDREQIAKQINLYNQVKREETEAAKAHFVEITDITRLAKDQPAELLVEDKLHPSRTMYGQWAERAAKIILKQRQPSQ